VIRPLRAPQGAPNVVIILIDDMGFGTSSAYGGPCHMPIAERLAKNGLTYTRFHTTALCSPTRQALLTGRNHHSVNMAAITEIATGFPGYTSVRPDSAATIAQMLKLNGYNTAAFGNMHQTPVWETSGSGHSTVGRPAMASSGSTALSAARRTSGTPHYLKEPPRCVHFRLLEIRNDSLADLLVWNRANLTAPFDVSWAILANKACKGPDGSKPPIAGGNTAVPRRLEIAEKVTDKICREIN